MAKDEIFSKLNIKNYNNELEKILETKSFPEGIKNLLLSMLYKIEIAYNDYNKVKGETKSKKEIIQDIINTITKDCNEIETIKPEINKQTILKNKQYIINKEQKKIISYPNEFMLLCALQNVDESKKINIDEKYYIIKKPVETMFNLGYEIDISEIIRDFDGWNWNGVKLGNAQSITYNLVFQNIKILLGNSFIEELFNIFNKDCICFFQEKINDKYEEEFAKKLYNLIYQNSILEYLKNNKQEKTKLIKYNEMLKKEIEKMENKSQYLQELANSKTNISKKIKKIDEILNNNKLLQEEFTKKSYKLKNAITLNEYRDLLKTEREKYIIELNLCNSTMNPINYVKTKSEIKDKIQLVQQLDLDTFSEKTIYDFKVKLQRIFLNAIREKIRNLDKKDVKEIIKLIYQIRYYKLLPIDINKQIKDIEELKKDIYQTEKELIIKACNLRILRVFSENIEDTLLIYTKILESKVIDLEEINIEFLEKDNFVYVNIYDEDIIEFAIKYKKKEEIIDVLKKLKIKFNKKIKII